MTKRMLIDSTHAEETRVVVLDGNRLEDYDIETATKQQLKGNIYLAKIVRVEPSLQAAFVEFGGGRHGFLAFGEIHPDYYQIPVADRKRLLEMQEAEAREAEEEEEREVAQERNAERSAERNTERAAEGGPERSERGSERGERGRGRGRSRGGRGEAGTPAVDQVAGTEEDAGADIQEQDAALEEHVEATPAISQPMLEAEGGVGGDMLGGDDATTPLATVPEAVLPESGPADREPATVDAVTEAGYAAAVNPEAAHVQQTEQDPPSLPKPSQVAQAAAVSQDIIVAPDEAHALFGDPAAPASDAEAAISPPMDAEATVSEADLDAAEAAPAPEDVGGDQDGDERPDRRTTPRFLRNYKIQEVMRRRQILLVQVVKEERGTKGAALTTYISLAGRFSVLMPNSPRGGGISRKITSAADRRRLKEITGELDLPRGMGLIVRTAGANRPKPEIIRDCEYLLNQWDQIRDLTMKSMAPALIYEEASLIKRAIRDVYSRDVDDILVDGEAGWRAARDFMRMLMPTHARKVQLWTDPQPLFAKAQVEAQLDAMFQPTVQLRSGGYLVINQTEALVAIDVNSGRSTRERGIEETALRTNMEAAEEAARQLRLRDLAGLIVIDFIDMESRRNNASVERKLKDALKDDRARIQIGSISHFGLLEMSRQRLRPSLTETSFVACPHCNGSGHVRGTESAALHVLRGIEEEGSKRRSAEIVVHVAGSIAFYILNHKRLRLAEIEARFGMVATFAADDTLMVPEMRIERLRAQVASELPPPVSQLAPPEPFEDPDEEIATEAEDEAAEAAEVRRTPVAVAQTSPVMAEARAEIGVETEAKAGAAEDIAETDMIEASDEGHEATDTTVDSDGKTKRRRRRRRGGARREDGDAPATEGGDDATPALAGGEDEATDAAAAPDGPADEATPPGDDGERKRRGRRGGRRRRREPEAGAEAAPGTEGEFGADMTPETQAGPAPSYVVPAYAAPSYPVPAYSGPTPADPFGGANTFDFFDALEEAEQARLTATAPIRPPEPIAPAPDPVAERAMTPMQPAVPAPAPLATAPDPVAEQAFADEAGTAPDAAPVAPAGPVIAPPIAPMVIGGPDMAAGEKKKGWWRR